MAVISDQLSSELNKRQRSCPDGYYLDRGLCYSAWNWYGRWVFAAGIIVVIIVIAFLWACVRARRRRRVGAQPLYGTGWMAGNQGQNQYYNNPQGYTGNYQPQPPPYGGQSYPMDNQYTGTTFRSNDGYYAQQHEGVQQPKNVYVNEYAPPAGPPPNK